MSSTQQIKDQIKGMQMSLFQKKKNLYTPTRGYNNLRAHPTCPVSVQPLNQKKERRCCTTVAIVRVHVHTDYLSA